MNIKQKILIFKKLKKFCLIATPRSGSDYFQSLIDGHSQALTFNGSLCLYSQIFKHIDFRKKDQKNMKKSVNLFIKKYKNQINTKFDEEEGKNKLGTLKNEFINIDIKFFKKILLEYLLNEGFTKKNFYLGVYFAYNFIIVKNFKNKKILLLHPHNLDELDEFHKDFLDACYIFTVRDFRAAYYSELYNFVRFDPKKFLTFKHHYIALYRLFSCADYAYRYNLKFIIVKLEHLPKRSILIKIAKYLGIRFEKNLLKSTFAGKKWNGDSKQVVEYKDKWSPTRTYNGWKLKLSIYDINIINLILRKKIKFYNYQHLQTSGFIKFITLLKFFLPMKFETEVFKSYISFFFSKKKFSYFKFFYDLIFYFRRILLVVKSLILFSVFKGKKVKLF